ncbi:hypothetical protein IGI04_007190 [Brassica rapa subsp. trilocularis]|uniref:Uncharacterized protein n=1 Tax=Brassica rapa subsp. trilocularis TaxID=1813537 RepID=A0ABQ7NL33_BRACM|nr:hypothetical protein IGI04_007190 [Brassica rapa subsp. trilocularis]
MGFSTGSFLPSYKRSCSPLLLSHHKSESKLCREFPEAENPSRRPLSLLRRLSFLLLSPSVISLLSPSSSLVPCGGGGGGCSRLAVVVRSRRSLVAFAMCIVCDTDNGWRLVNESKYKFK